MFETAELGHRVPGKLYKKSVPVLRQELLELQRELGEIDYSQVILYFAGVDKAGKGETISLLNGWMDARWLQTRAFGEPADVERERPEFWRYWLALPPRGRIGMFLSAWYSPVVLGRALGTLSDEQFEKRLDRIVAFERALAEDGAVIVKFWMHLSREAQRRRLKALEKNRLTRGRVTQRDWDNWKLYDRFTDTAERAIARTNTGGAPWHIVEGEDANHRVLTIGGIVRDSLRRTVETIQVNQRVEQTRNEVDATAGAVAAASAVETGDSFVPSTQVTVLSQLDMTQTIPKEDYRKALEARQSELILLNRAAYEAGRSSVLVVEGPDAAGKGGAIRRVTAALDPRLYQVYGFAAPSDEERAQHYLWRFWRRLPRAGHIVVFDRSWYGRVLVERVEGFASRDEWSRAYQEINDFEEQLTEHGVILLKFWVHISPEEQLERFRLREETPYKRWKLTEEDWRNRARWGDYEMAVHDMVQYTSTASAPWTLVEGNDKRYARIRVLETVCRRLSEALEPKT
jgi:polyphosphate:AMP phosphotransferase